MSENTIKGKRYPNANANKVNSDMKVNFEVDTFWFVHFGEKL